MLFWIVAFIVSVVKYRYCQWMPDYIPEVTWVFAAAQMVLSSMEKNADKRNELEKEKYIIYKAFEEHLISADNFKIDLATDDKE